MHTLSPEFWYSAFQSHGTALLAYLRAKTKSHADAEDLLQETFVKAMDARNPITDVGKVRSYLFTIAHNTWISHLRRKKKVVSLEGESDEMATPQLIDEAAPSPEQNVQFNAFRNRLTLVLKDLNANYRKAFELALIQGDSYAVIAQKTGWTKATVKSNVYRARQAVIARLGDHI